MLRFAANLTVLFTEIPMLERFRAAAGAGFEGVEVLFPYDFPAPALHRAAVAEGLEFVLINTPRPDGVLGPLGCAAMPEFEDRFREDFDRALDVARALRSGQIHVMAGSSDDQEARHRFVTNLKWAARRAPDMNLTIEPLNSVDMPGYFLNSFDLAADIIDEVNEASLGLQYDSYHAQAITGDAVGAFVKFRRVIRHIQVGGYPGRHEPANCDVDHQALLRIIDASGYHGWVSAEYNPVGRTEAGLGWLSAAAPTEIAGGSQVATAAGVQEPRVHDRRSLG